MLGHYGKGIEVLCRGETGLKIALRNLWMTPNLILNPFDILYCFKYFLIYFYKLMRTTVSAKRGGMEGVQLNVPTGHRGFRVKGVNLPCLTYHKTQ